MFNLSKNTLSRYQINILLCGLKFTPTPTHIGIQLKSDIHNYTRKLCLTECLIYKNFFETKSNFTPSRNTDKDLDHQIDVVKNLDLEGMGIHLFFINNPFLTLAPQKSP